VLFVPVCSLLLLLPQGTMSHMAPEVMLQGRISKAADVYSFGISLWDLFTGGQGKGMNELAWSVTPP
jgi:serine/threonine protein kinase